MNRTCALLGLVVWAGAGATVSHAEETLESLELKVTRSWAKVQTMSATTRLESERTYKDRNYKKTTTGTYYFLREGDKELVRQDLETNQDLEMTMGQDAPMKSIPTTEKKVIASDGEKISTFSEGPYGQRGGKSFQAGSGLVIGGRSLFVTMFKGAQLQILPDSRVEGREAWAIQAIADRGFTKTSYLIDKEWGVLLQRVTYQAKDDQDLPATTYTVSNIKVNAGDVTSEKVKFEFPPGMEIEDATKLEP